MSPRGQKKRPVNDSKNNKAITEVELCSSCWDLGKVFVYDKDIGIRLLGDCPYCPEKNRGDKCSD